MGNVPTRPRCTTRIVVSSLVCAITVAGCTIRADEAASPVPLGQRGQLGAQATGGEAVGSNRIFLVAPATTDQQTRLRSVQREGQADPMAIILSLFAGPNNEERDAGLTSVLPDGIELIDARLRGRLLTVDINDAFRGTTPDALRLGVAQLVATASEIDGVERLRLQIEGENVSWPLGDGQNTARQLTLYDYPGFVESTQPAYPAIPTAN